MTKDSQNTDAVGFGTQIRKSPYFDATMRWGAAGFSVYNHMYIPRDFGDPVQNFWNLVKIISGFRLPIATFCSGHRVLRSMPAWM